jgi:hypothetical protein
VKIDATGLTRQLKRLPAAVQENVKQAVYKSTEEAARVAKVLAPNTSGETKAGIRTEYKSDGMMGTVVVIDSNAPRAEKDRAYSIEHGRKKAAKIGKVKGQRKEVWRGTTEGYRFVGRARQYMGKRWSRRIRRAVRKAAKEVTGGG